MNRRCEVSDWSEDHAFPPMRMCYRVREAPPNCCTSYAVVECGLFEASKMNRKLYLRDPTKLLPRTTDWRLRKRQRETLHLSQLPRDSIPDATSRTPSLQLSKKRKLYLRDSTVSIPRQTLWSAKKKEILNA